MTKYVRVSLPDSAYEFMRGKSLEAGMPIASVIRASIVTDHLKHLEKFPTVKLKKSTTLQVVEPEPLNPRRAPRAPRRAPREEFFDLMSDYSPSIGGAHRQRHYDAGSPPLTVEERVWYTHLAAVAKDDPAEAQREWEAGERHAAYEQKRKRETDDPRCQHKIPIDEWCYDCAAMAGDKDICHEHRSFLPCHDCDQQ